MTAAAQLFGTPTLPALLLLAAGALLTALGQLRRLRRLQAELAALRREAKIQQARLAHQREHDFLTGLPRRERVAARFAHLRSQPGWPQAPIAVLFLDLDRFTAINEALGHASADRVLATVAARLSEVLAPGQMLGRLDGDEFVLVLPGVDAGPALDAVMHRLQAAIARPCVQDGQEVTVSFSAGAALCPAHADDFAVLCQRAHIALADAKARGRHSVSVFNDRMDAPDPERMSLLSHMHRALERGEFVLHYQPQIDLHTGCVTGAEALVRWQHPLFGLLMPGRFIELAEESGLIVPLGRWVLQEACRQAGAWRAAGLPPLVVAVNLSAAQFRQGDLESSVEHALQAAALPPACLELELTESILIRDTDNVLQQVQRLKGRGLKLSIDDFGTGYSSLSYLKKFAVDKIKIDRSFVAGLTTDADDAAIVRAIIQLARSLDLRTIAEGVEDAATAEHLRLLRCDEIQGYHYARPLAPARFAQFLQTAAAAGHAVGAAP